VIREGIHPDAFFVYRGAAGRQDKQRRQALAHVPLQVMGLHANEHLTPNLIIGVVKHMRRFQQQRWIWM
jgi:hypothetical protein